MYLIFTYFKTIQELGNMKQERVGVKEYLNILLKLSKIDIDENNFDIILDVPRTWLDLIFTTWLGIRYICMYIIYRN